MSDLLDRAAVLLSGAAEAVLVCHVAPDGDALGSLLALGLALERRGTRVVCTWGEPELVVPDAYAALPGQHLLVPPARVPEAPELLVTLDTSSRDRLGLLAGRVDSAGCVLVVDHHTAGEPFGDVRLVDPSAAATVVLVADLLDRLGTALDLELAAPLYTGLLTDTGAFTYRATTPAVHALAARLLATGLRHDEIARAVFATKPFGYLRVLGRACASAVLEPDAVAGRGLVWAVVRAEDLAGAGVGLADVEGVIDVVRTAQEAEVAVVLKEEEPGGALRVSVRSKGAVDVGAACASLGGGGHRLAAGFTSAVGPAQTLDALRRVL